MNRKRYFIYGNFGNGYEEVCEAENKEEAERLLQEYIENDKEYPYKIRITSLKR